MACYSLERKRWFDLHVDKMSDVVWNKEAFDSLVLDRRYKRVLHALVSGWLKSNKSGDFISGKGNGLVLLLEGASGAGKTLTAESLAESLEMPLLPVVSGDLGADPERMKSHLEDILALGSAWGCMVLLDDMDMFLEERWPHDNQHAAVTSVLARTLEYHDGVIVFTSGKIETRNPAFKSRMNLRIPYPELGPYQRAQVWKNLISRLEKLQEKNINFDDLMDHVEELSQHKLNGRQIRNVITAARQFAQSQEQQLNYELMKDIVQSDGDD